MMVKRRAAEDTMLLRVVEAVAPLAVLEHVPLQNHRHRLRCEDRAHESEQELGLEKDCDGAEPSTERQRARIAHEHFGGMRVVPEEADQGSNEREAEDRELTGALEIKDLE